MPGGGRRLGGYLMFRGMASLAVSSALWMTATSGNAIGAQIANDSGVEISFGKWLLVSCVPALAAIALLPRVIERFYPHGVKATGDAPARACCSSSSIVIDTRSSRARLRAFWLSRQHRK